MNLKQEQSRFSRSNRPCRRRYLARVAFAAGMAAAALVPQAAAVQAPVPVRISPALPSDQDTPVVSADILAPPDSTGGSVSVAGKVITLYVNAPLAPPGTATVLQHLVWQLPALPVGGYTVSVSLVGVPDFGFMVHASTATLSLIGGRFTVAVAAQQPGAVPQAVQLSDEGGYYTYFNPEDVEITVKALDGTGVNGHFWVFIGSMTDTPYTVTITDITCAGAANCPARTYTNPAGANQNFIDVAAF
jgi:hypothetical protein